MNFFEIMKYFARAIEQMRAVDGILIPKFPWPNQWPNGTLCIYGRPLPPKIQRMWNESS